ncbi:MAG: DNA mismatch repair protein MutL [Proteobacteria bacterium]|nr:MAG: DNA mismatch repair protein MutL [Pseudomonadota bacterium]
MSISFLDSYMSKIRVLPEILSNKIAAGEVVERPASVVKELVENAIDAGSTRIMVEIEQGGRKLIRVSDNGQGMGRDDALLCLERYATSKIASDPDLFAISTLGFRGEALPSIAAVSRFNLVTRASGADIGTRIDVAGGRINQVADTGAPVGTMITVAGLFYNTPARRKFLKSINTEMGHIADTIASMALCRPAIQFRLSHNNRVVKSWAAVSDPANRVADVLGASVRDALCPVDHRDEAVEVRGWVAAASLTRSTARGIYVFVNGRWVKDRIVRHAVFAGYSGRLMKGQYPVVVIFLKVPFDQVDVNVHPTKHEIRFVRQKQVHDTIRDAVFQGLKQSDPTRWNAPAPPRTRPSNQPVAVAEKHAGFRSSPASDGRQPVNFRPRSGSPRDVAPRNANDAIGRRKADERSTSLPPDPFPSGVSDGRQEPLWKPRFFADLTIIGQYKGTYIICESADGLILIDQHAAHERIVFETLKRQSAQQRPSAQRLLIPETIDLGFREAGILEKLAPALDRYGLEIDPFGGNTFAVKAVPTLLDSGDVAALVTELVEKAADIGVDADTETILDGCLMVMACHNAIRAHQRLSDIQISIMLEQLDICDNPSHCPHGRPIWIRWTLKNLEKQFHRIV